MRNLRKLKVNADVTFVIWILEWVGYLLIIILWAIGALLKVDILLDAIIVVYYVMLPHCYLMNTSHNKDRIIDEGLKNIIKNVFHIPFDLSIFSNLFGSEDNNNRDAIDEDIVENNVETGERKKEISIVDTSNIQTNDEKVDTEHRLKNDISQVEVSTMKPSSSSGICEEDGRNHLAITSLTDSEDDPIDEDADDDLYLSIKKQLLIYMKESVNNEENYIHYLLQLIDLETKMKNEITLDSDYKIIKVLQDEKMTETKSSFSESKNRQRSHSKSKISQVESESYQCLSPHKIMVAADRHLDRTLTRLKKLESIDRHCDNEETFNKFLDELIDFEEGLTED